MSENVLAVVAGKELTEAQFEAYLKSVPREQQMYAQNPQYREQYKEQFIARMNDRIAFVKSRETEKGGLDKLPQDALEALEAVIKEAH